MEEQEKYRNHAIDTLPEGYVFLGKGGEFKSMEGGSNSQAQMFSHAEDEWEIYEETFFDGTEDDSDVYFAAPAYSEIAKLNGHDTDTQINEDYHIDWSKASKTRIVKVPVFPYDADDRKEYPVGTLIKDYFPHAIAALANHSFRSQQQHGETTNGAPMEWLKDKSIGDGNQMIRHFLEDDYEAMAWRALELLERKLNCLPPFNK